MLGQLTGITIKLEVYHTILAKLLEQVLWGGGKRTPQAVPPIPPPMTPQGRQCWARGRTCKSRPRGRGWGAPVQGVSSGGGGGGACASFLPGSAWEARLVRPATALGLAQEGAFPSQTPSTPARMGCWGSGPAHSRHQIGLPEKQDEGGKERKWRFREGTLWAQRRYLIRALGPHIRG